MKTKLIGLFFVAALSCQTASAVSLATSLIANTATNIGLITTLASGPLTNVTGTAYIYSSSTQLASIPITTTTRAAFESLLTLDPGAVRSAISFTNGAVTSSGSVELGAVGNRMYVWMSSTDGTSYGAYKGITVPSLGGIVMNSNTLTDLGVGTSTYAATGTSGFQLAYAVVPEPSAALLGALGALGLLRRRRN
jgi:MYXO-CTERM domain-containing protein